MLQLILISGKFIGLGFDHFFICEISGNQREFIFLSLICTDFAEMARIFLRD
jgi:hypothetical protein